MRAANWSVFRVGLAMVMVSAFLTSCATEATSRFYGKTEAPDDQVLRYVSGSEPESFDPAIPTGQPEARLLMAIHDGLVEYHPKTMKPIPAIAESWEISPDVSEYIFYLRKNATFSNGDPIKAQDFVYSFQRALEPEFLAKNAYLAYYIKYAEAFNSKHAFVRRPDGTFILKRELAGSGQVPEVSTEVYGPDTEFGRYLSSPERLTVPADEKGRAALFEKDEKLKALTANAEFVPVVGSDLGVEAIDDYTLRIKLRQSAPFFIDLLSHQFFKVVHRGAIEKHGKQWVRPENIVTSGAFKVKEHHPYDRIVLEKDPRYWDAESVRLNGIEFYPLEEATTMMNLYKAGSLHAVYNAVPPAAWIETLREFKAEYMDHPAVTLQYYTFNVTRPPMDNEKVRRAFALAIDREALATWRKTTKPTIDFTPIGIFPDYEEVRDRVYTKELAKQGRTLDEWKAKMFDPERARALLAEAGYPVTRSGNSWSSPDFPISEVELLYNTSESNKAIAEFIQAQWRQNLGLTVPLKNMEWKTFLNVRKELDYRGIGRAGWVGDYMDPFTFLKLFYTKDNDSSTGWYDPKFDSIVNEANRELDPEKRFELLALAEFYVMDKQPVLPLMTDSTNWMKKPFVKGMYPNPQTLHPWKFVYIETDADKWDQNAASLMKDRDESVLSHVERLMSTQTAREATSAESVAAAQQPSNE
ncbi:MAG TPA: peptide ABC transporter substrate-binding protein [Pyrinomonadaceae bacterium]|nr:peptide ABC transporter substrate-binding protein [Pyrinomonadaceae bacterium]